MSNQELEKMIKDSWMWKRYECRLAITEHKIICYEELLFLKFIPKKIRLYKINNLKSELEEVKKDMNNYMNSFSDLKER